MNQFLVLGSRFADQLPSKRFLPHDTLVSMPIPYYHIDSFANELFAGNPAGICLVPAFPANDVMQKIAAENRHSETAFVVARADGDFDLRWFPPVVEELLRLPVTMTSIMCAGFWLHPRGSTKMLRPDQSSAHSSHTGPDALASKHFECSNSVLAAPECGAR